MGELPRVPSEKSFENVPVNLVSGSQQEVGMQSVDQGHGDLSDTAGSIMEKGVAKVCSTPQNSLGVPHDDENSLEDAGAKMGKITMDAGVEIQEHLNTDLARNNLEVLSLSYPVVVIINNASEGGGRAGDVASDGGVETEVLRENLGLCTALYAPSLGSSFLVDHGYAGRRGCNQTLDDQIGLVCERTPPDKGYFSDQGSSRSQRRGNGESDSSFNAVDDGTRLSSSGDSPSINS